MRFLRRIIRWFYGRRYWMHAYVRAATRADALAAECAELTAEADFNGRAAIRLKAEAERLAEELKLSQAFARDGYRQFREAREELDGLRKRFPTGAGSGS